MADETDDFDSMPDYSQQATSPSAAAPGDEAPDFDSMEDHSSSAGGAFVRGAAKSVLPTVGALPAIGFGAEIGGIGGGMLAGPPGAIIGGIAGGAAGGLGAGYALSKLQKWVMDKAGLSDDKQDQADVEQHPYASEAGELLPALVAFQPGKLADSIASRVLGGGIMGGLEAGQELAQDGSVDPTKVAIAGGFGAVANRTTAFGERALALGAAGVPNRLRLPAAGAPGAGPQATGETPPDQPGRPDAGKDPEAKTAATVDATVPPNVARGVSTTQPAPLGASRPQGRDPTVQTTGTEIGTGQGDGGSARVYPTGDKETGQAPPKTPTAVTLPGNGLSPEITAAFAKAVEQPEAPQAPPVGADAAPQVQGKGLGLVEAAKAAKAAGAPRPGLEPASEAQLAELQKQPLPPRVIEALRNPALHEALANPTVDRAHEVPNLAGPLTSGGIAIDRRVPAEFDWRGVKMDVADPLRIHEHTEAADVKRQIDEYVATNKRQPTPQEVAAMYDDSHENVATPAELAYVEHELGPEGRDAYTHWMDGLLSHIEHAPVTDPPPTLEKYSYPHRKRLQLERAGAVAPSMVEPGGAREITAAVKPEPVRTGNVLPDLTNPPVATQLGEAAPRTRNPEQVEGLGVQARDKADAARKQGALKAAQDAFDAHPPPDAKIPTSKPDLEALRARLQKAVDQAGPITYVPREKPAALQWLRAADRLLKGMTPARVREFITNEQQLRSGNAEDAKNVQQSKRIEADIEKGRAPTTELAEDAGALRPEEPDHVIEDPDQITNPEERIIHLQQDQERVITNLVEADRDPNAMRTDAWRARESQRLQETAERTGAAARAREAANMVNRVPAPAEKPQSSPVRKVKLDAITSAEAIKRLEALEKKLPRPEPEEHIEPPDGELDTSEHTPRLDQLVKKFLSDTGGAVGKGAPDIDAKVKAAFKRFASPAPVTPVDLDALIKPVSRWLNVHQQQFNKWIENTLGVPRGERGRKGEGAFRTYNTRLTQAQNAFAHQLDNGLVGKDLGEMAPLHNSFVKALDARWGWWQHVGREDFAHFSDVMENFRSLAVTPTKQDAVDALVAKGVKPEAADIMADEMRIVRKIQDQDYQNERAAGSEAGFVDDYLVHAWKESRGVVQEFIDRYKQVLGPRWMEKERSLDTYAAGIKAGLTPRFTNLADLITYRHNASISMLAKLDLLRDLNGMHLSFKTTEVPPAFENEIARWTRVSGPDHSDWVIHPDINYLWRNVMDSESLWMNKGQLGSVFRGWMAVKNAFVPVKLMLSAFHQLHVAGVAFANNIARGIKEGWVTGDWKSALQDTGAAIKADTIFSLPLDKLPLVGKNFEAWTDNYAGKSLRQGQDLPRDQQTPQQRFEGDWMAAAGFSTKRAQEEAVNAYKDYQRALSDKSIRALPAAIRMGMESMQMGMFNHWIPRMKAAHLQRDVAALLKMRPDLMNNPVQLRAALGAVGKSTDDRFGEMFYKNLFWNKALKDISIGSFLSLGWNLGQVRQLTGAVTAPVKSLGIKTGLLKARAPTEQTIHEASNKGAYVASYVATSMLMAGGISYMLSGQMPSGMDYVFPKAGGTDEYGQPRRLQTMFNTREAVMVSKHIEEQNSVLSGLATVIWNKTILQPLLNIGRNKDYFGNQLFDPDAPAYKEAAQLVDSVLGDVLNPIVFTGAQRAKQQGGGTLGQALSFAGFSPAPAYVSRSAIENRITHDYERYVATTKPYDSSGSGLVSSLLGAKSTQGYRTDAKGRLNAAVQSGDRAAEKQARADLADPEKGKMSSKVAATMQPGTGDVYQFSRLPLEAQKSLVRDMTAAEFRRYVGENKQVHGRSQYELRQIRKQNPNP